MKIFSTFLLILLFLKVGYSQNKPMVGLVLSGGGAKGIAHVGVIRELEKKGIRPDVIVGTSAGALVGGMYAAGLTPDQLEEVVMSADWDYLMNDEIHRENLLIGQGDKNKTSVISLPLDGFKPAMVNGLFQGQNLLTFFEIVLRKYNKPMDFDDLVIPFRCVATNLETGEAKIFENGKLADAMRASMSIPSVYAPYEIDDELYIDGGLVNNLPTDIAKELGAEIIIGVDVGAVLYKKEEINSILQILDQSSSFYNARVSKKNAKLCDIYIRPDIEGLSALSFGDIESIINRGVNAYKEVEDKVDSVFNKYELTPIVSIDTLNNRTIRIQSINYVLDSYRTIKRRAALNLMKGKMDIETPCVITEDEFKHKINRLYGSRFFKKISTSFNEVDSGYVIEIKVEEKVDDDFNIGIRYDTYFGINLKIGANFRNKLIYGSLLEMNIVAGQAPQLKLRYTTDRGSDYGIGTSFQFDNFFAHSYQDHNEEYRYNYNRIFWDVFVHRYFENNYRAIFGVEAAGYGIHNTQSFADFQGFSNNYGKVFAAIIQDSWDRNDFPTRGNRIKGRTDLIVDERGDLSVTAWLKGTKVIDINTRWKVITSGFLGFGSYGINNTLLEYRIGGLNQSRIQWYSPMPGLLYLEEGAANTWQLSVAPRWEFIDNNFITYKFAVSALDPDFVLLFLDVRKIYGGMSLEYSYNSMFGPLSISGDYSFTSNDFGAFMSLGYWF
ncbi:MAG: patatin-like phospholipase family protein [Bacteroidales bacterium]|nr:patatin-like phospholipase family protein [Bacteroidales bacterium]